MNKQDQKYPEGYFVSKGMAIGIAIFGGLGIVLSTSSGNSGLIGVGPALGISVGLAIGSALESKYKREGKIRPRTEDEIKTRNIALLVAIILLVLGLLAALAFYLLGTK